MSVNPNLRNPLALFALCFLVTESTVMAILMYVANHVAFCTWAVNMLTVFVVAFPTVVFSCFIVILFKKPEVLYSLYEQAIANRIMAMTNNESKEHNLAKASNYGISSSAEVSDIPNDANTSKAIITEESILEQYIAKFAPFMRKNMKAITQNGSRYFDGYANWNGCNYVVEVKRLEKWTEAGKRGVQAFSSNARSSFFPLHTTLVLCLNESSNQYHKIAKDIHEIDPAINVIFANSTSGTPGDITFSEIY